MEFDFKQLRFLEVLLSLFTSLRWFLAQQFLCWCHSSLSELWPPQHGNQIQGSGVFLPQEDKLQRGPRGPGNGPWHSAAAPRQLFLCHTTCLTCVQGSISAASAVSHCSSVSHYLPAGQGTFSSHQLKNCTGLERGVSTAMPWVYWGGKNNLVILGILC